MLRQLWILSLLKTQDICLGNPKIIVVAISPPWYDAVSEIIGWTLFGTRMHYGHFSMLWMCFRVFFFFFRKYRKCDRVRSVYVVCALALWFVTIGKMLEFMRRNSIAKRIMHFSFICNIVVADLVLSWKTLDRSGIKCWSNRKFQN